MSDEMVQEKTETAADPAPGNGRTEGPTDDAAVHSVSSEVGAAPTIIEESAPAQASVPEASLPQADAPELAPPPEPTPLPEATPAQEPPSTPAAPLAGSGVAGEPSADSGAFEREMQALDMHSQYDESLRQLHEGDVIVGTVMRVDREGVLVDVGAKSEGIIRPNELSREQNFNPNDIVKVGDKIKVFVLEAENQDGNPILSKKRADFEQAWDKVQHARETGETLVAMVTDRVKGGLVVDLGIRGFVPASHVGSGSLKNNLEKYVGQSISLKVIEVDKERRKVVLSNKLAVQEEREARSAETKSNLSPGQVRHGVVRRLTNYGAFIDLGGIDGLLHISEMSWTRINDPKEVLREGQELDVLVLKMDLENNRVSLGLRQILPDPWTDIPSRYKEGDEITGTITRLVPFGAFVQVEGGVEGVLPNNEMLRGRSGKGGTAVAAGDEVRVKIIDLRPSERKMTLSLRALQPPEEREPVVREGGAAREGGAREGSAREGGGGGRERGGRGERDRGEREDYTRYAPGRNEEPRFTIGDAIAAQRRERKRDRREVTEEYDENLDDLDMEEAASEPPEAASEPPEAASEPEANETEG